MVPVDSEQLLLLAAIRGERLDPFDPAHDQPTGHVLVLATTGERNKPDFGDLGVGDPPLLGLVEDSVVVRLSSPTSGGL